MPKKILLIIAHQGFQPLEYGNAKKVLEVAGVKVVTASDLGGMAVSSLTDDLTKVDVVLSAVKINDYDGIFFVGGPGALDYLDNDKSYRIIKEVAASGKLWGAICISPRILAKAGVLKGRTATGWNEDGELGPILEAAGATYKPLPVVQDGRLITADGPASAEQFGRQIALALSIP